MRVICDSMKAKFASEAKKTREQRKTSAEPRAEMPQMAQTKRLSSESEIEIDGCRFGRPQIRFSPTHSRTVALLSNVTLFGEAKRTENKTPRNKNKKFAT